jgi:hypothetical protein
MMREVAWPPSLELTACSKGFFDEIWGNLNGEFTAEPFMAERDSSTHSRAPVCCVTEVPPSLGATYIHRLVRGQGIEPLACKLRSTLSSRLTSKLTLAFSQSTTALHNPSAMAVWGRGR